MKIFLDDHSYNISRNIPRWQNANSDDIQNYRNTSENLLKTYSYHTESISKDSIDHHLQQITVSLLLASDKHIPCGKFRPFLKPYWKKHDLNTAHFEMRNARRRWKSEGSPRTTESKSYKEYKMNKNSFRKLYRHAMKEWHQSIFDEMDKATEIDIGTFYKTAWKNHKKSSSSIPNHLNYNGTTATNINDMCQLWREYYSDLAEEEYHPDKFNNDFKNHVDDFVQNIENSSFPKETLIPVSTDEIHNHVKNLKKGKAPGPDFLTNEHILYGGNILLSELCELFNSILKSKYVPEMFKTGKIITVYKGKNKDKYNPVNYRGITLTSVLSKLFEKIVLKRIENSLIEKKISFPHELQFGFRDDHGALPACLFSKNV